jgi:hypothetical protein
LTVAQKARYKGGTPSDALLVEGPIIVGRTLAATFALVQARACAAKRSAGVKLDDD